MKQMLFYKIKELQGKTRGNAHSNKVLQEGASTVLEQEPGAMGFARIRVFAMGILVLFLVAVSGCNFKFGDASLLTEPTVDYSSSIMTLSIPKISKSTKYINVYRIDVTEDNDPDAEDYDDTDDVICIGMLFPENLTSTGTSYQFQDTLVWQTHKYRYRVRYCEPSGYYYSNWSNVNKVTSSDAYSTEKAGNESLTYLADGTTFEYDDTDFTLTIKGDITAPSIIENFTESFEPALIISTGRATKIFKLPDSIINAIKNNTADGKIIHLRDILSSDFLDTEIIIEGLVGQKTETLNGQSSSTTDTDSETAAKAASTSRNGDEDENVTETESETETDSETVTDGDSDTDTDIDTDNDTKTEASDDEADEEDESEDEDVILRIIWTEPVEIEVKGAGSDGIITVTAGSPSDAFDYSRTLSN